jgi:hypothetical protein
MNSRRAFVPAVPPEPAGFFFRVLPSWAKSAETLAQTDSLNRSGTEANTLHSGRREAISHWRTLSVTTQACAAPPCLAGSDLGPS